MNNQEYSNIQPTWKFIFLYVITLGAYTIPWSHKHWKFIKDREKSQFNPWVRAIFFLPTMYWLVKKIFLIAEEKGYRTEYSPFGVVALYALLFSLQKLPNGIGELSLLLSFLPLLTVVNATNYFWKQEEQNLPIRQTWTTGEVAWTIFGIIFWLLFIYFSMIPTDS
jgi:hypothetical protein